MLKIASLMYKRFETSHICCIPTIKGTNISFLVIIVMCLLNGPLKLPTLVKDYMLIFMSHFILKPPQSSTFFLNKVLHFDLAVTTTV